MIRSACGPAPSWCCWPDTRRLRQPEPARHAGTPAGDQGQLSVERRGPRSARARGSTTCWYCCCRCATGASALDAARIEQEARWLAELKPGASWIACELTRGTDDAAQLEALQAISDATGLPLVAAGDVQMHARRRKRLHDVLTAVRVKTPLAQCGRELAPNAERYLRPLYRLARIYPTELLLQTQAIAERCTFSLDELRYEYPEEIVPAGETPATWLRRATYEEAKTRYPDGMPDKVKAIVEHELALIADLRYEPYFLTVYDIVRFARSQGILCQGRGSAANSAVCYCLGITEVDPARM